MTFDLIRKPSFIVFHGLLQKRAIVKVNERENRLLKNVANGECEKVSANLSSDVGYLEYKEKHNVPHRSNAVNVCKVKSDSPDGTLSKSILPCAPVFPAGL